MSDLCVRRNAGCMELMIQNVAGNLPFLCSVFVSVATGGHKEFSILVAACSLKFDSFKYFYVQCKSLVYLKDCIFIRFSSWSSHV